jgi:uncharacterized Zn finger protein
MLPETRFTDKEKRELDTRNLAIEMAHYNEWIVADEALPDDLLVCYVSPTGQGDELEIACSCADGAADRPCAHALAVLNLIRSDDRILVQLHRRKMSDGPLRPTMPSAPINGRDQGASTVFFAKH